MLLATVHFTIAAGKQRLLHFHLTPSGWSFLRKHPHAKLLAKVTARAGRRRPVTTTFTVRA